MASRTINIPATTNLDADELTSGTVPFARLSVGTGSTQVAFTNSTLYVMSRGGASLFGDGRMVGLAVFPGEVSDADAARLAAAT